MPIINSITPGSFTGLSDTPDNYTGEGNKYLKVKNTEDGLEFVAESISATNVTIPNVDCLPSVYVGAVVRMNTSGIAENALADTFDNSNMIGVVISKEATDECTIRVIGVTGTIFVGLDPTKEYYLSDTIPGGIQTTVPTTSGHVVLRIGQPFSSDRMMVIKGQRTVRL